VPQITSNINNQYKHPHSNEFINELLDYAQNRCNIQIVNSANSSTTYSITSPENNNNNNINHSATVPEPDVFTMTDIECFDCLRKFMLDSADDVTITKCLTEHECTSECVFFNYKPCLYICKTSGRVHICSSKDCNRLVVDHEHRVCELTCFVYTLDTMENEYHNDQEQQQNYVKNHTRKKVKHNNKTIDQQNREITIKKTIKSIEQKKDTKLTSAQRHEIRESAGYQRPEIMYDTNVLYTEAMSIINHVFSNGKHKIPAHTLAGDIVKYWSMVNVNLVKDNSERAAYVFKYHVLACLYEMQTGYAYNDKIYIPHNQTVALAIPRKRFLHNVMPENSSVKSKKQKDALSVNRITTAQKLLKKYIIL